MKGNKIKKALHQYAKGKISIGKAAELADVSIWKFLE